MDIELQAQMLAQKVKHYLITTMGVTIDEASDAEFYRAFSLTLREEIMINWTATLHTWKKKANRIVYYICMEYMPGRSLSNAICNINATPLVKKVVSKLGKEFSHLLTQETDPGLGNGGLGRLAACLLDSLATQDYPAVGYGLRYQYGIFDQEIWGGEQIERPDIWLKHENPWEFRRDGHAVSIHYGGQATPCVNKKGAECWTLSDFDEVRAMPYDIPVIGYKETPDFNVATLRLWTTKESPRNFQLQRFNAGQLGQASENTCLTDVLYPNDNHENGKRIRLKQEFLLSSASVQDIIRLHMQIFNDISLLPDKVRIQLNDTHPALAIVELMKILLTEYNYSWQEALEITRTCCSYTNHTVLKEALEEWNQNRLESLFPVHYRIIERMNLDLCNEVRKKFPGEEDRVRKMSFMEGGQIRMANLSIYGSHVVNGVAALHSEIIKKDIFKDFYQMNPEKFINVTNGVTQRRWLLNSNPMLSEFITKRIGKKWATDLRQLANLRSYADDQKALTELMEIKKQNKEKLADYLEKNNPIRDKSGKIISYTPKLDTNAIFEVHIKRFHEYKRQLMSALHALMVYDDLLQNPDSRLVKRMLLFGGKAAPGYEMAKKIIHLIYCIARKVNNDPQIGDKLRVVMVENYNVSKAEIIIPGSDLSTQISTAGMEASGTGNMKLSMNGALTIGTEDGANIEMHEEVGTEWWPFSFGANADQVQEMLKNKSYNPQEVYTHNPRVKRVLDMLTDRSLAVDNAEHQMLSSLYHYLLEPQNGSPADRYFVLHDIEQFYQVQKNVDQLYADQNSWAKYSIQNIAGMGKFSTDESIHNYAKLAWDLNKCPVDHEELKRVREEYSEHDKCRVMTTG